MPALTELVLKNNLVLLNNTVKEFTTLTNETDLDFVGVGNIDTTGPGIVALGYVAAD